jgi:hypothetical protein
MEFIIIVILVIYTLLHVVLKLGGLLWVMFQLYIVKSITLDELKEKSSIMKNVGTLWWSLIEHFIMTFVFIWIIVYLW